MMKPITLAALTFALTACASTNMAANDAAQGTTVKMADGEKKVCKRERKTGTRFYEEVCYTQEELEQQKEDAREAGDLYGDRMNRTAANPTGLTPKSGF